MDFVSSENLKAADDVDATTAPAWSDKPADDNDKWVRRDASGNWKAVFLDIPHHSIFEEDITILPPRRRTAVNQKSTITVSPRVIIRVAVSSFHVFSHHSTGREST